ncbi:MAG: FadR/GntR family transcriptional regulator [Pseudomonadota bacterium]
MMDDGVPKRLGSADLAAVLRREIAVGGFRPDDRLPPGRDLALRFGVDRGTVREALARLARDGLVETRPGSGTYVVDAPRDTANPVIENARPLELIDARFALEQHVCRLAVLHARRTDLAAAESLLVTMEANVDDPAAFAEADGAFHILLAESTGNSLMSWMVTEISSVRSQEQWARMLRVTLEPSTIRTYNAQHRAIVDAIRNRDPERASAVMKEHLETARLSLTRAAAT